jgi:hypothetical protein
MARLLYADPGSQLVYRTVGSLLRSAVGKVATVYADAAATTLADIATYNPLTPTVPGAVIATSTLTVDSNSLLPWFWGPLTAVDTLWVVVDGGPITQINAYYDPRIDALTTTALGTGVLTGGELNASLTPSSLDISATVGFITDYTTTPSTPTTELVSIPAQTVLLSDLVGIVTWWMIDSTGAIIQQGTRPTNTQRRTHIQLGATAQSGGVIFVDQSLPVVLPQVANQLYDLMYALGAFNAEGNIISAGATDLTVARSSGSVFSVSSNHFAGPVLTNDPHVTATSALNPIFMIYATRSTTTVPAAVTSVDPANYDLAGVVTAIGGSPNNATIQRVFFAAVNTPQNQVIVQYGQRIYVSLADAVAAAGSDVFVKNPLLGNSVLLGYLCVLRGATNLADTAQAQFIVAGRFIL